MSKKSISKNYLEVLPNDKGITHLKVEIYYDLGGMNYFSGSVEGRGIKLSVSPVQRNKNEDGVVWESYTAFSGFKKLVKEMTRFNQKTCNTFVLSKTEEEEIIKIVLNHNWLTLK